MSTAETELAHVHRRVLSWFDEHARDLPWRAAGTTPWEVFVSEVMSQQTPVARVVPIWQEWMRRWPTPADLASAAPGDAVRLWGRLGYPRRALRLREAAVAMVERHDGEVPTSPQDLLALPGVGAYTAAAVASFAHGLPEVVVDTNVRRVLARALEGRAQAAPALTAHEARLAAGAMPPETDDANAWNAAVMELGALVCTARSPRCEECPVSDLCAWRRAGSPAHDGPVRRGQSWHGTDRQVRGRVVQLLRESVGSVSREQVAQVWPQDPAKVDRCLAGLVEDGLVEPDGEGYRLPV
ncbi:A/G-specific adenine glycosylase [Janibacter sp. UYMM211]|uniref:A/G-specific adenine glycosylase n=1 Tax=Janibacter sp. UYMM211 TaxID=3156342 RepID=UPI0033946BF7